MNLAQELIAHINDPRPFHPARGRVVSPLGCWASAAPEGLQELNSERQRIGGENYREVKDAAEKMGYAFIALDLAKRVGMPKHYILKCLRQLSSDGLVVKAGRVRVTGYETGGQPIRYQWAARA